MSKYNIRDVDELVECPYDPLHMIRVSRFPYHLIKCAKVRATVYTTHELLDYIQYALS